MCLVLSLVPTDLLCSLFRFFAINTAVVYLYYSSFQKIDEEDYGGISELLKEGLMTSFSTFLVSFILTIKIIVY